MLSRFCSFASWMLAGGSWAGGRPMVPFMRTSLYEKLALVDVCALTRGRRSWISCSFSLVFWTRSACSWIVLLRVSMDSLMCFAVSLSGWERGGLRVGDWRTIWDAIFAAYCVTV